MNSSERQEVPYGVREQHFSVKHHDTVGPFVEIMLGVYSTCQWESAGSHINLETAHDHVFGNHANGSERCEWCFASFERRRDYQKEFFS